jgi:hypothetical protein
MWREGRVRLGTSVAYIACTSAKSDLRTPVPDPVTVEAFTGGTPKRRMGCQVVHGYVVELPAGDFLRRNPLRMLVLVDQVNLISFNLGAWSGHVMTLVPLQDFQLR